MLNISVENFELKILSDFKINYERLQKLYHCFQKTLGSGRQEGWVGGWMGGKAGLRIAYSNQKII